MFKEFLFNIFLKIPISLLFFVCFQLSFQYVTVMFRKMFYVLLQLRTFLFIYLFFCRCNYRLSWGFFSYFFNFFVYIKCFYLCTFASIIRGGCECMIFITSFHAFTYICHILVLKHFFLNFIVTCEINKLF